MDVSVIIVSYNSSDVLKPCLESLRAQRFDGEIEVIVVDNASSDGAPEMVSRDHPWVRLVASAENLGYSRGVNLGIRHATGEFFFILNPDTVLRPDTVARLFAFARATPDAGIVAPRLVFHDGNVQLSCRRFYTLKVLLLRRTPLGKLFPNSKAVREHLMEDFDHEETRAVDWVLGAAMFVRKDAVEAVGLMDERFFLYFEDVDWCYRMHQNGLKVYFYPEATITHGYQRESAQSVVNRSFLSHLVSLFRYYEKWHAVAYFIKRYREIAKTAVFLVLDVVAFNLAFLSAYWLRVALGDLFTNPLFPMSAYGRFVVFENLLFVFTFTFLGLYRIRRETRPADELFDIARAIVIASVLLMTSTYLGQIRTYSRMVVAFVVPFAIVYDWLLRWGARRLHHRIVMHKVDLKRACIVGPMSAARELEDRLVKADRLGLDIVGIVDTAGESGAILTGTLGPPDELPRIVDRYRVQEVFVLPGALEDEALALLIAEGRRRALDVTVVTDYAGLVFQHAEVTDLLGRPVITYRRDTRYRLDKLIKRAGDIVGGVVLMFVSAVPFVLYSMYALSRGVRPFQYEERVGLEGEPFTMPSAGQSPPAGPSDFVNLPLFWLVVVGRLSLVGPYPLRPDQVASLGRGARFRFGMRPGVTGSWRDSDGTSVSNDDIVARDADYARNWSLSRDVRLWLTTVPAMVAGRGRNLILRTPASDGGKEQ